jgi:hypothetical protein
MPVDFLYRQEVCVTNVGPSVRYLVLEPTVGKEAGGAQKWQPAVQKSRTRPNLNSSPDT